MSQPTRFTIMRHALTSWNRVKKIQGQTDIPLCDEGREQAALWAERMAHLTFDRIMTSDLGRAIETAEIITQGKKLSHTRHKRLREQHWGTWTARHIHDIQNEDPVFAEQCKKGWAYCPPDGESRIKCRDRVREVLLEAAERWPGERILVVTHLGTIKCLLHDLLNDDMLPGQAKLIKKYRVHTVTSEGGELDILDLNNTMLS